jgi:hypothetical protein
MMSDDDDDGGGGGDGDDGHVGLISTHRVSSIDLHCRSEADGNPIPNGCIHDQSICIQDNVLIVVIDRCSIRLIKDVYVCMYYACVWKMTTQLVFHRGMNKW